MATFCSSCGSSLADDSAFCNKCGSPAGGKAQGAPVAAAEYIQPRIRTSIPGFVKEQMHPAEQVLAAFPASMLDHRRKGEFRHDKFVLTTERIIYYHTSMLHKGMGAMPYRGITESHFNKGLRHGAVVVEAANAGLTISGISNDDASYAERIISSAVGGRTLAAK